MQFKLMELIYWKQVEFICTNQFNSFNSIDMYWKIQPVTAEKTKFGVLTLRKQVRSFLYYKLANQQEIRFSKLRLFYF